LGGTGGGRSSSTVSTMSCGSFGNLKALREESFEEEGERKAEKGLEAFSMIGVKLVGLVPDSVTGPVQDWTRRVGE
jgi:hypothetical protein